MRIGCTNNRRAATTLLWGAISPRAAALGPTNQRAGGMQVRPELRGLGGRMRVLTELAAAVLTLKTDERFAFLMIDDHRCSAAGLASLTSLTDFDTTTASSTASGPLQLQPTLKNTI